MLKQKTKYSDKIGSPPGALDYIGKSRTQKASISQFDFSKGFYNEIEPVDFTAFSPKKKSNLISWIHINGIHDVAMIEAVGKQFNLDPMVLEDIVNTNQRPKSEEHEDYLFTTLKTLKLSAGKNDVIIEQISLVLGKHWLLTFQEAGADAFGAIKERIRSAQGHIPQRKEDFLYYRLIDTVVDNYFLITDAIGEKIEDLEDKLIADPDENLHSEIYVLKKKIALIKKATLPLRDAISTIMRSDFSCLSASTKEYFRDVYEHLIHVIEGIDSQHETLNDLLSMYLSGMSNKMNEVMQVLTIFAAIFIPLTFIAGVYGMNFKYMPELQSRYGYFVTIGIMVAVGAALLLYFRKKKWL